MIELLFYFISLMAFFFITFQVLKASNLENVFKKNKIAEIKTAYILISLVFAHILASIVLKFLEWAMLILK